MKRLINLTILTLLLFSFIGCFDDEARLGGFPHIEITDTVHIVTHEDQTLEIPFECNRSLSITISTDDNTNNNTNNYPNNYYPNGDPNSTWVSSSPNSYSSEIISLHIKENYAAYERVATITVSAQSSLGSFKIKVTQMPKEYSQAEIFQGDAILSTPEEITDFISKGYKEIKGNLIIGTISQNRTKTQNSTRLPVEIDGTTHYFQENTAMQHVPSLSSLRKVSGGIYVVGLGIQDLYFMPQMTNLETLVAVHNPRLENISSLQRLTKLKKLHLNNNNISDLTSLSHLTTLETLYLGHTIDETNTITDISPLLLLPNLKELYLEYLPITLNQLNDLKTKLPNTNIGTEGIPGANPEQIYHGDLFLRTQQDVTNFIATGYKEVDGSIIIGNSTTTQPATFLTNIWVNGTNHYITQSNSTIDLSSLKIHHIQGDVYLIGFPNITDLSSISSLSKATKLHIKYNNRLTDVSILSKFTRLESLYMNYNQVSDISHLGNLTKIKRLQLNNNNISDITILSQLRNLESLYLGLNSDETNTITNIYSLHYLENLNDLYINYLRIPLSQINELKSNRPNINIRIQGVPGTNPNLIHQGDLILSTQQDVTNFISTGYTEIYGNLFIGNTTTTEPQSHLGSIWLNSKEHYITQSSSTLNLSSLRLSHIQEKVCLMGFQNITDLNSLSSLRWIIGGIDLHLSQNNNLADISILNSFSKLRSLNLSNSKVSDISSLSHFTSLTSLSLSDNQIANISSIGNLTGLTSLTLNSNQITDISNISNLTGLTNLYIYNEDISNITPLSLLRSLNNINLQTTQVSDISPLRNLTNLTGLTLGDNQITDISSISNLTGLTRLSIYSENINNITPVSLLRDLNYFHLSGSQVSDISSLGNLTNLTDLTLGDNTMLTDFSPLSNFTGLSSLSIDGQNIDNLTPLVSLIINLANLSSFSIGNSQVSDISPLLNLPKLTSLSLIKNAITDFSSLSNFTKLTQLSINSELIDDLSPIYSLTQLEGITLGNLPNITKAKINALKTELPNCTVSHWGIN